MKQISTLLFFLLIGTLLSAQTIKINKNGFFIDKVKVTTDWMLSDFRKGLGEADSILLGATYSNKVHYYEKRGYIFWEPMVNKEPGGKVLEIQIFYTHLDPSATSHITKRLFQGSITIDNLKLDNSLTASDVKDAMRSWTPLECYFQNGYKYTNGIVGISFVFNKEENEMLWVDIVHAKK